MAAPIPESIPTQQTPVVFTPAAAGTINTPSAITPLPIPPVDKPD